MKRVENDRQVIGRRLNRPSRSYATCSNAPKLGAEALLKAQDLPRSARAHHTRRTGRAPRFALARHACLVSQGDARRDSDSSPLRSPISARKQKLRPRLKASLSDTNKSKAWASRFVTSNPKLTASASAICSRVTPAASAARMSSTSTVCSRAKTRLLAPWTGHRDRTIGMSRRRWAVNVERRTWARQVVRFPTCR
jgi:hypothetical protein